MAKAKPETYDLPPTLQPDYDSPSPLLAEPSPKKQRGKIVGDPELIAMNRIQRIIEPLTEPAKLRVIAWLKSKAEFPLIDIAPKPKENA